VQLPRTPVKLDVLCHPCGLDRASSRCTLSSVGALLLGPGRRRCPQAITRVKRYLLKNTFSKLYGSVTDP
jgi:hypothetical protein